MTDLIDICLYNCYGIIFKKIQALFSKTLQPGLVIVVVEDPKVPKDPKAEWEFLDEDVTANGSGNFLKLC